MAIGVNLVELSERFQKSTAEVLRRHRRRVAENTILPSATPEQRYVALRGYRDDELFERAKRASASTVARTATRAASAFAEAERLGVDVWLLVEGRSGGYDSWYTFKAGVQRYLEDELDAARRRLEAWQGEQRLLEDLAERKAAGAGILLRIHSISEALKRTPVDPPESFKSDGKGKRRAGRSKSQSIRTAKEDWRERVAEGLHGDRRLLFLLQCATGCRPQELANGVQVRICRDGTLVARVKGAKCDEFVGQPSRCIKLDASRGIVLSLAMLLKVGQTLDSRVLNLGQVNTYAKFVARACERAFPRRKGTSKLSAYSARHQFKADLVKAGWSRVDIAMAMGHSTTRSGTAYGQGGKSGSGGVSLISVKAVRPVKLRGEYPKARSGVVPTAVAGGNRSMVSGIRPRRG